MPYLDLEPEELRRMAEQHGRVAADIRKWGRIPHTWLAEFASSYGTIADPVRGALMDYYTRRHAKAERRAAAHERTRDNLIAAAAAMEDADESGGHQVARAGDSSNGTAPIREAPPAPAGPVAPAGAGPLPPPVNGAPLVNGTRPDQPSATTPHVPGAPVPTGRVDSVADSATPRSPHVGGVPPVGIAFPAETVVPRGAVLPSGDAPPRISVPESVVTAPPVLSAAVSPTPSVGESAGAAGAVGATPVPSAAAPFPAAVVATGTAAGARLPEPLSVGPFVAAIHPSRSRRAFPSFVVGERVEEDLTLARTLLAATLAAVARSVHGPDWAVAVMRTPAGPVVLLTSTEGRGWLPSGLFLPAEVALPWEWDVAFGPAAREVTKALEGTADPARMLAEFGLIAKRRGARISALASSVEISEGLREALGGNVAVEGRVYPAEAVVDLASPGSGLVDRLAFAGSDELRREADAVPDAKISATCLELARSADAQIRRTVSTREPGVSTHRAGRRRILDALTSGSSVPVSWWDQLRAAERSTAALLRSWQVDVSDMPVGRVPVGLPGTEDLRGMVFERRADELLLLLAKGEPDRQTLRDALYTYGQIAEHPLLPVTARVMAPGVTSMIPRVVAAFEAVPPPGRSGSPVPGEPSSFRAESVTGPVGAQSSGERRKSR